MPSFKAPGDRALSGAIGRSAEPLFATQSGPSRALAQPHRFAVISYTYNCQLHASCAGANRTGPCVVGPKSCYIVRNDMGLVPCRLSAQSSALVRIDVWAYKKLDWLDNSYK